MWTSLVNILLSGAQLQFPFLPPQDTMNTPAIRPKVPVNKQFELKSGRDILHPKDLLTLPRPGLGVVNPWKEDLVALSVSEYSFDTQKTNRTIYVAPLNSTTTTPVTFPLLSGGEFFWLDARTLAHVVGDDIYAVSLEYEVAPEGSSLVNVPTAPYLVGSFPSGSGATNFKFTGSKKVHATDDTEQPILVFSAAVYDDYNLTAIKEHDDAIAKRTNSAKVFDELYVRHWDEYVTEKKNRLFSVELSRQHVGDEIKWALGGDYFRLLENTEHYTPVAPFGGTDDFDVSSTHVVYTTLDPSAVPSAAHTRQLVYIVPLKGGLEPRQLSSGHHGATHSPVFSRDGQLVAWTELAKDGYESDRAVVVIYDLKTNKRWTVTEEWDRSVTEMQFSADGKVLYVTASEHGHAKIFKIFLHPTWKHATPEVVIDAHSNHGIQVLYHSGPDTFAFTQSSYKGPNNVFLQSGDSKLAQITHFGKKELKEKDIPNAESFWFHSEGNHVQGWSFPPPGYDAKSDKKYPGLLLIHGGPQGAWEDGWSTRWNPAVFAAQGYWVIAINPTGSTGFGQAFTDAITKDWGGRPFVDLRKGWAYALKHFPIDKHRTGAAGASWGGYAINWIQGHPEYGFGFKALFCHDGIFDAVNGGYTTDETFFWSHDFGGEPWNKKTRDRAERFSPAEYVHKWSTPQLVVHGGRDYRLAETEGLAAFNALQLRGVPSRLVVFPDENHWVLKPGNSYKWHYEVFRWFDAYVTEDTIGV